MPHGPSLARAEASSQLFQLTEGVKGNEVYRSELSWTNQTCQVANFGWLGSYVLYFLTGEWHYVDFSILGAKPPLPGSGKILSI